MIGGFQRLIFRCYSSSVIGSYRMVDMTKSYEEAVQMLNGLQSNAATIEKIRSSQDSQRHQSLPQMIEMTKRAGMTLDDIDRLSVIHVSGTKGKGSTCAFTESILRQHGFKTGFYSSPHLVEVRERIRINGQSLSRDMFSKYFWDCYQLLDESKAAYNDVMPAYFRFLTIMAFHVFLQEKVDVVLLEVGIGGQYDCTNIVRNPVVCGVTSLGIDHTSMLGDTVDKIAWHKAGIFKPMVPAVTVPQPDAALAILQGRAKEIGCPLYMAPSLDAYDWRNHQTDLGIPGMQQQLNASLALQLSYFWLKGHHLDIRERQQLYKALFGRSGNSVAVADIFPIIASTAAGIYGLNTCVWPGRNQKISGPGVTYYLDGAHTPESVQLCAQWFNVEANKEAKTLQGCVARVLIFNSTGDRKLKSLLHPLLSCNFDCAVFCPNVQSISSDKNADLTNLMVSSDTQLQRCFDNRDAWLDLFKNSPPNNTNLENGTSSAQECFLKEEEILCDGLELHQMPTMIFKSISSSLAWATRGQDSRVLMGDSSKLTGLPSNVQTADHIQILCVGSLHLIGGILGLLDPAVCDAK